MSCGLWAVGYGLSLLSIHRTVAAGGIYAAPTR